MDPLVVLPAEIVLRILHYASLGTVTALAQSSRPWNAFIESAHREIIYASKAPLMQDAVSLKEPGQCFRHFNTITRLGEGVESWKEACRRLILLERSWRDEKLNPRETLIQVGNNPVWRFRPDFKRRFIVSTSHAGGLNVTDIDTGQLLWSLDLGTVRRFAHLEYQDGTAVWDRFQNTLEVWKTDLPGLKRGEFRQVALLPHDVITRGFQLSYQTLCVVSSESQGFVYDFPPYPEKPNLRKCIEIEEGAVGHLDQDEEFVMYSMGTQGYHIFNKTSGELQGHIHPHMVDPSEIYHISHPIRSVTDEQVFFTRYTPAQTRRHEGLTRLWIENGPLNDTVEGSEVPVLRKLDHDEWGAGMVNGNTMVGFSRDGRLVLCSDWRRALRSQEDFTAVTCVIECDPGGDSFDLGGWLHLHETVSGKRIIFEIKDSIYILSLNANGKLDITKPGFAAPTCSRSELAVPVSFMGVYDDCIMNTFTSLGVDSIDSGWTEDDDLLDLVGSDATRRHFLTKAIRTLNLAPEL
ncbi:hypothetical protein F5Y15DRAFT_383362 [Xylariaceae sp. FL0016]|nr:hypothetical protein F5Y15DRAFT_383362 [Xylariaceae sp. FL0016]